MTWTAGEPAEWLNGSMPRWTASAGWISPEFFDLNPMAAAVLLVIWASGTIVLSWWRWTEWRGLLRLTRAATPLAYGREVAALARARPAPLRPGRVRLLRSRGSVEPAVLGIIRPALLWPADLSARLTDAQLEAVLAHELCHVRRRDNAAALVQVVVEILFWFHPVVWWVGARLVSERERACDEEVLQMGTNDRQYAEAILKVCDFSLRAPAFVAAVGASDLSQRIERILSRRTPASLTRGVRLLLGSLLLFTAGAPLGMGVLNAQRAMASQAGLVSSLQPGSRPDGARYRPEVHRPGNGITWPRLVHEVKPAYTPEAIRAGIQGMVTLEAVVREDGTVGDVTLVESLDTEYGLDQASVHALEQWVFEPATSNGEPAAVVVPVEMSFTLK